MVFTCQAICVDWPLSHAPISVLILTLRMVLCTDWAGVLYLGAQGQQGNEDRWPVRHFGTISRLFDLVATVKQSLCMSWYPTGFDPALNEILTALFCSKRKGNSRRRPAPRLHESYDGSAAHNSLSFSPPFCLSQCAGLAVWPTVPCLGRQGRMRIDRPEFRQGYGKGPQKWREAWAINLCSRHYLVLCANIIGEDSFTLTRLCCFVGTLCVLGRPMAMDNRI